MHSAVEDDASDAYHDWIKYAAVPSLVAYSAAALLSEGQQVSGGGGDYLSTSGDSGLQMSLSSPMPSWMLAAHGRGAIALVGLVLLQKEIVRCMASDYASFASAHRAVGYLTLTALLVMDAAGYSLCSFSTFAHFRYFAIAFALPFAVWLVGIWATARAGYWRAHAFLANMLLKGSIATPLSRLGGAALQKRGMDLAPGYYTGIFGVALVILVWQVVDFVVLARQLRSPSRGQQAKKGS